MVGSVAAPVTFADDGEARAVSVWLDRDNAMDGIVSVRVEDDGHGISADEVEPTLDPVQEILCDTNRDFVFGESEKYKGRLRIIEWRSGKHRAIYFGPDEQHFVHEEPGGDVEAQYPYSAYVTWEGLDDEHISLLGLGDLALLAHPGREFTGLSPINFPERIVASLTGRPLPSGGGHWTALTVIDDQPDQTRGR